MNILARNQRRHRAAVAGAIGCALALVGCPEPNLKITVKLPDGYSKDSTKVLPSADGGNETLPLIVELAIYAPTDSEGIDCEKIAWGDVPTLALRSARIYNAQLVPDTGGALNAAASVSRTGTKFAVALGAFEFGELGITLREAVLAGCTELGDIEGDLAIAIETVRTASIPPMSIGRDTLFLSADVPAGGVAPIVVSQASAPGEFTSSTALHLGFRGDDGSDVQTSVRILVVNSSGVRSSQPVFGPATAVDAELTVDAPGPFTLVPRLRYQQGDDLWPIDGLAYRTLASSSEAGELATALARAGEVAIGPIGATAVPTFVLAGPPPGLVGPPASVVLFKPHAGTSGAIEFDRTVLNLVDDLGRPLGRPIKLLGFSEISGGRSAVFAATAFLQPTPPAPPVLAHLVASAGGSTDPEVNDPLVELTSPSQTFAPTAAAIGPCVATPPPALLLHLGEQEPSPAVDHFWLYDPAVGLSHANEIFKDPVDPTRGRMIGGLQQSLCVDDEASPPVRHRLLFVRAPGVFGIGSIFDLSGSSSGVGQIPPTPAEAALPGLLRDSVLSPSPISINGGPERLDLLAPVSHNDQFEINQYTTRTGAAACNGATNCFDLAYKNTSYSGVAHLESTILKVDTAVGHLTSADRFDLALLVVRVAFVGQGTTPVFAAEIGLVSGGQIPRVGTIPLSCAAPEACKIYAGDVDGDGIDELLVAHLEDADQTQPTPPPTWRAQIIRFAP